MGQSLLLRYLALLCFDRLLRARIYPPGIQADRIFGRDGRAPELVPISHAKRRDVVMRDYAIAILQYPVESAGVSDEARSIRRLDQLLDQFVDHLAVDAEHVLAPRLVGGLRPPIVAQFVPRRLRCAKSDDRHV